MHYIMAELGAVLSLPDGLFILRDKGEETYPHLKAALEETPEGQPLVLVFPADQLVDASFADESIVRLGQELVGGEFGQRCLLLEGVTEDSVHNIKAAIELQKLKLAFLAVEPSGEWRTIGRLEPSLRQVLEILARRDRLTTVELADLLDLAVNTASNRLKRLYDQHLVRREHEISETGLQYIYYFWQWTEDQINQSEEVEG
jgi:DNA-binding transcriptional ArsR family regulator